MTKHIVILGGQSYIGSSFESLVQEKRPDWSVSTINSIGLKPTASLFKDCDVVLNVAGIVHRTKKTSPQEYELVNHSLATELARSAKEAGVNQFIQMSTISVYGKTTGSIAKDSEPKPSTPYGLSKLRADEEMSLLTSPAFHIACIRPPMVYGQHCKGNYRSLRKLALATPVFPRLNSERSMIFIGNLCHFLLKTVENEAEGLYLPQDSSYVNVAEMVRMIAVLNDHKLLLTRHPLPHGFEELNNVTRKVLGSLVIEKCDLVNEYSFHESMALTECGWNRVQ